MLRGQLECLAIKRSVDRFKYLALGTEFSLENNHRALQWLETMEVYNYLVAAVNADTVLHIKCPQVSFSGKSHIQPVPHPCSQTKGQIPLHNHHHHHTYIVCILY